jgi:hypothetical protein
MSDIQFHDLSHRDKADRFLAFLTEKHTPHELSGREGVARGGTMGYEPPDASARGPLRTTWGLSPGPSSRVLRFPWQWARCRPPEYRA